MLATPVIEIAEDGITAQAVWPTPGTLAEDRGGTGSFMAAWIWENYAQDFAKEDGVWKIWHRVIYTDLVTSPTKSWTSAYDGGPGKGRVGPGGPGKPGGPGGPGGKGVQGPGDHKGGPAVKDLYVTIYETWTPTVRPENKPRIPMPYKTFTQEISYAPPPPKAGEEKIPMPRKVQEPKREDPKQ